MLRTYMGKAKQTWKDLFADDGLTVMTGIFFPNKTYNKVKINQMIPF